MRKPSGPISYLHDPKRPDEATLLSKIVTVLVSVTCFLIIIGISIMVHL